ncbi:hypothetical protein B0T26DRAFT_600768, partial [Lasiosphaeria miniovina]
QHDDVATDVDVPKDAPDGNPPQDNSYVSRRFESIPVQKDSAPVEDPIDARTADTDQQLERDDVEAIDKSNILKGKSKTRHAKPAGSYKEPSDEDMGLTE